MVKLVTLVTRRGLFINNLMQLKEGGGCHSYYARGHRHGLFALDKVYKDYPKMCAQKCRIIKVDGRMNNNEQYHLYNMCFLSSFFVKKR